MVECLVQKVLVQRRQKIVPTIGWLAGQRETLVVELAVEGSGHEAQNTTSGTKLDLKEAASPSGGGGQEAWVWGEAVKTADGVTKHKGDRLDFEVTASTEMRLQVLGGMSGWYQRSDARELLGEVRFRIDEDVVPSESHGGALSLPLVQDSRVQGTAWLNVKLRRDKPGDEVLVRAVPGAARLIRLKGHRGPVTGCAVFPDGRRILTVSSDQQAIIWSASGQLVTSLHGHASPLTACAVFPSGEQVLTVASDATATVWSTSGMQLATLSGARLCVLFPSGDKILAATGDDTGAIFSASGEKLAVLQGHSQAIACLAVFPNEEEVLTCSEDEECIIWSSLGDTVRVLRGHTDAITCCAVADNGKTALTGSKDKTAILWQTNSKNPLHQLRGHQGAISCCTFFAKDSQMLTGGEDGKSMLWSAEGDLLVAMNGHTARVTACLSFKSREWLLTVSADKTGIVWSRRGQMLGYLHGHADGINACGMFKSEEQVVTVANDHTGLIWPLVLFVDTDLDVSVKEVRNKN